jgi:hypothetical protein
VFQNAYQAGSDEERRSGVLKRQMGFMPSESAGIASHTAGTAASATTNAAGYAVGATTITLASAGTGTILAGDVITFAGDTNKYVVVTGDSDVSNGGTIVLAEPGLRIAMSAATKAITMVATYTANLAFERSAIVGVMRPPLIPANPTIQQMPITDHKGMTYLMLDIAQYGMRTWELHLAWGFKTVNAAVLGHRPRLARDPDQTAGGVRAPPAFSQAPGPRTSPRKQEPTTMSDRCKTVRVVSTHPESQGPFVEINEEDFDKAVHKLFKGEVEPEAKADEKPAAE